MKKRILGLLLALIMVLQYVPGEVFAQTDGKLIANHPVLTGMDQGYTIDASLYSSEASAKTISILGDSISTYQNWSNGTASQTTNSTITNGEIYYPRSGFSVTAESTWWYQAAQMLDLEILVNNSWSGSCLLNTRSGTVGAYVDRCIQLHDDTGENAGQKPDIIAIYLGTNDYYTYSGMLGSFEAIDFAALIQKTESSFRYAQPATSLEAYAIILHKIAQAYPDAEVYCFTLLPRVNSSSQPTAFNTDVCQLAEHFGVNTVDLFDCGIQKESTAFYKLMGDNLHPNDPGMDAITNAFVSAVLKNSGETTYDVSFALDGAVVLEGTTRTVTPGDAFEAALAAVSSSNVLEVTVTMDGVDITGSCWDGNRISVPKVTGNISVTAVGKEKPQEPENAPVIDRQLTNFRWELRNNTLENVTDDQNSANGLTMTQGSISGGVTNNVRYTLDKTIYLNHDQPWSVEWQSSGTWGNDGGLLFAQSTVSNTTGSRYLYRRCSNSMFALGVYENGTYHNYAVEFAGTGIDTTKTHVFRLTNRIAPDGSNMIWLHVDDTEVGPLNQYWDGGTDKNTTSNWLSGKNFQFSYMGTQQHPLTSCTIDYVQVWETGTDTPPTGPEEGGQIPPVEPEDWTPADYRWELKDNALVSITTDGNTANDLIRTQGSVSNGVHSGGRYTLTQSIKLYHDRPWVLEWKSEGSWANSMQGAMLFAQSNSSSGSGYYFYRRSDTDPKAFFGFGECKGGVWYNYGITLSQYGIDDKVLHTYRLVNRIAEDNNMVYLYVDDAEIGPLNGYNVNGSNKGTTSNWVSGKDFVFHYMGTDRHTLDNCTIHYIQVWENGPHSHSYEATVTAPTCTDQGYTTYTCACGDSYVADYVDATGKHTYESGICTGCGEKKFSGSRPADNFRWEIVNSKLTSITDVNFSPNAVTVLGGSITNGVISSGRYQLAKPLLLLHDQPWMIEWRGSGDWTGMLLATTPDAFNEGLPYFFKTGTDSGLIAFGHKHTQVENYGLSLKPLGLDYTKSHTYCLENRIHQDGTNMVYLLVDNVETGPMNRFYIGGSDDQNQRVDWLSGKDFNISVFGTSSHPISRLKLEYLQVRESSHTHSYEAVVTPSTCTKQGCTTYTCACGVSYVDDYMDVLGHTYENGICTGCGAAYPTAEKSMQLRYDDHLDVTGKSVEILDAGRPVSYQVGYGVEENKIPDTAVVSIKGNALVATGIGTAIVKIDGETYEISVTAAPINLLLLIGQSNMQGVDGNASESIVCPTGQVYATYADRWKKTVEDVTKFAPSALTGEYSTKNVTGDSACLKDYPVNMLTDAGNGREGMDSGIAYEWVKQTGEKVWTVNVGYGGSSITQWQEGGIHYKDCLELFAACQETLRKEIAAGHFTLSHMAYFWCQGCADENQTASWYVDQFLTMHETLQKNMAFREDVTFEFAGIIPIRSGHEFVSSYRAGIYKDSPKVPYHQSFKDLQFNGPRVAQYWMGNNPELADIWNVCTIQEGWATLPDGSDGVAQYFQAAYPGGVVDYTTQVKQSASWYKPTTPAAVHDNIHYNQIGYNELGRESARNALILLGELAAPDVTPTVEFLSWDGFTPVDQIVPSTTGSSDTLVVPMVYPIWKAKTVTYAVSEGLRYEYYDLLAESMRSEGTLTSSAAGAAVNVALRELTSFRWDLKGNDLVSATDNGCSENILSKIAGSVTNGIFSNVRYRSDHGVQLLHTEQWCVEVEIENWTGPSGIMVLSTKQTTAEGEPYFYFRPSDFFVGIGCYNGSTYDNYGISLKQHGIACSQGSHTYRFVNRISDDGSNMVYLIVDEEEIGALTDHYVNSTLADGDNNWLSGRDFAMPYFGTTTAPISNCTVRYIAVTEAGYNPDLHRHDWSDWETVTAAGPDGPGEEKRTCLDCGEAQIRKVNSVWQTHDLDEHLVSLPEGFCCKTNLWTVLPHDPMYYYSGEKWAKHESGKIYSVTVSVNGGDKIFATSFGKYGENGNTISTGNGIRVTFFDADGVLKTMEPQKTYDEFAANGGYIVAPEGSVAVNIPMYSNSNTQELYILNHDHTYENGICTGCCVIKDECIWQILDNGTVVGAYAQLQEAMDACKDGGIILLAADSGWIDHASTDKDVTIVFGGSAADDYAHTYANGTCSVCGDMIEGTAL